MCTREIGNYFCDLLCKCDRFGLLLWVAKSFVGLFDLVASYSFWNGFLFLMNVSMVMLHLVVAKVITVAIVFLLFINFHGRHAQVFPCYWCGFHAHLYNFCFLPRKLWLFMVVLLRWGWQAWVMLRLWKLSMEMPPQDVHPVEVSPVTVFASGQGGIELWNNQFT